MVLPAAVDVGVSYNLGLVLGGALLVLLGAFVARLPDIDLRVGLPHRGMTHSTAAAAAATMIAALVTAAWIPPAALDVAAVTGAAYVSHLAADAVNPMPQALFWPLPGRYRPRWLPAAREASLQGRAIEGLVTLAILGMIGWRVVEVVAHR